jgi:chitinase
MRSILLLGLLSLSLSFSFAAIEKVVCYWPNWRLYKKAPYNHSPEDIDASLCTHIHYAFHLLDEKTESPKDSDGSPQAETYKRLNALKQKNHDLKLVLSLGGGGEKDAKYSHMISNPETRKTFIHNTIAYLHKYGFDGLDLDWEYPVCWGGNCNKGPKSDFENFAHLLKVSIKLYFLKLYFGKKIFFINL